MPSILSPGKAWRPGEGELLLISGWRITMLELFSEHGCLGLRDRNDRFLPSLYLKGRLATGESESP